MKQVSEKQHNQRETRTASKSMVLHDTDIIYLNFDIFAKLSSGKGWRLEVV